MLIVMVTGFRSRGGCPQSWCLLPVFKHLGMLGHVGRVVLVPLSKLQHPAFEALAIP